MTRRQSFASKYEPGERRLDITEFVEVAKVIGFDASRFVAEFERIS